MRQYVGAEAEPLGHAGTKALDQRVGLLDQLQHRLDRFGLFEIERDRAAAAIEQRVLGIHRDSESRVGGAIDPEHIGAHVREQHRAHRSGADPGEFDDSIT